MTLIFRIKAILVNELKVLILCHEGRINKMLHIAGFAAMFVGIYYKSIYFVLGGAIVQELGHFYQYYKTGLLKHSPLTCLKPQSIFAYPLLLLIILYVSFF